MSSDPIVSEASAPVKTEQQPTQEVAAAGHTDEVKEKTQKDATPAVAADKGVEVKTETEDQTASAAAAAAAAAAAPVAAEAATTEAVKKESDVADTKNDDVKTDEAGNRKNRKNNCKFDATQLPDSDDPEEIRCQVEFYFGDQNLPQDKFLWEQTGGFENKPISLKTIHSFKRMQRFKPYSAVVAALRVSKFLVVEGEDGEETIRRQKAYEQSKHNLNKNARSVYVKGFGDEEPTTQFKLEAWFLKSGPFEAVRLRRAEDGSFKGSVFTEYKTEEAAKAFLALDPKPTYEGKELEIMSKQAYVEMKRKLIEEGKIQPSKSYKSSFWEGKVRGAFKPRGGGKSLDKDNWKERRDYDQKNGQHKHGQRGRGRGRGRGQRGGNRGRGGRRNDSRNEEPPRDVAAEEIREAEAAEAAAKVDAAAATKSNGKRPRDEEAAAEDGVPAAKKVDTKPDLIAAES